MGSNQIINKGKWIKIWDFHFSIWFLERWINVHLKFPQRLGNENRNTINLFNHNSESAYFLEKEIKLLKPLRKRKILNKKFLAAHYKSAYQSMKQLRDYLRLLDLKVKKPEILYKIFLQYTKELENMLSYYRASRPEIFEIVEKLAQKDEERKNYYSNLIVKYGQMRFDIKKEWLNAEKVGSRLRKLIANNFDLKLNELEYLTDKEIGRLFHSKTKSIKKIVNERKKCVFGIVDGKIIFITDKKEVQKIFSHLKVDIPVNKNIIRGNIANKGIVMGKVRLVPQTDYTEMLRKAKLLKRGEILVTGMTQPDIIFACKKAAAIITDEGGITCHAAIISRELKIPCIIGTKIATKVLHDGDLVEVDADKGVVKILKRA